MDKSSLSQKQLNELELQVRQLLLTMRKAKLQQEPVAELLHKFELELGELRRQRFDNSFPEYSGY